MKQRTKSDCAIAAIATATGMSYARVRRTCGSTRGGLYHHEIAWLLDELGVDWRCSPVRRVETAASWAGRHPKLRAVVCVRGEIFEEGGDHAMAAVDGRLIDPAGDDYLNPRDVSKVFVIG